MCLEKIGLKRVEKNQKTTYSYMSATLSFNSDSSVEASLELPML